MVGSMKKLTSVSVAALLAGTAAASAQDDTQPVFESVDEIVVRGVNIPDEKKATSEISAVLDEAAFERQGDSNIADALKRVTGLSLSNGKFVIVRGLNERYSNATLNGSNLPSPEPLRRVAPLDIFPTSVLSGSLVQKTFSPEFSAEFGGGAIDLRTKSLPEEAFFEIGGSIGLDTVSTARDGLTYDGGDTDWAGFGDSTRDVPAGIQPFFLNGPQIGPGLLTEDQQNALDATVDPATNFLLFERSTAPNYDVRLAGGNRYDVSDALSLGFVATVGFESEFVARNGERRRATADNDSNEFAEDSGVSYDVESNQQNVGLNALVSVGAEIYDNHEIALTGILLRSTTKEARIEQGFNIDLNDVRNDFTEFVERQVWQAQATGEHVFPGLSDLSADWRFAYGKANRDSPFETRLSYLFNNDGVLEFDFTGQQNDISTFSFSELDDEDLGGGIDFVLPLSLGSNALDLKAGYAYTDKQRDVLDRRYQFFFDAAIPELAQSRFDVIGQLLPTNQLDIRQITAGLGNPDNFSGDLQVHAAYASTDVELGPYLRLAAGVRYETGEQTSTFSSSILQNTPGVAIIDEDYFLPAATITWNPTGNFQLRAGFSQTIVRPQFREIAPISFNNPDTDIRTFGNLFLQNSEIDNFDARIEWYFNRGEFLTIGGFYKDISNPIEEINASALGGGDQGASTFVNSPSAELYGLEFEFQKNFVAEEIFQDGWLGQWAQGKDLVFITNYTWTQSDVDANLNLPVSQFLGNGAPISSTVFLPGGRSLEGQSDHIANVQIGYENLDAGSRMTFLLNYASERIQLIGNSSPSNTVIERPPVTLDWVYSRDLEIAGGEYTLSAKIGNILGDEYDAFQVTDFSDQRGEIVYDRYDIGRTISLGLTRRF